MLVIAAEVITFDLRTFFALTWTIPCCLLIGMGTHHDNDNEPETWSPIGLAALVILNRLRNNQAILRLNEKADEQRDGEPDADRAQEEKREAQRDYVLHRLRSIEAFERTAKGLEGFRGKRRK
ncbi:hypothetical protein JQ633_00970 [Bradyrhizobium tropiciagri]|uniref:hypothetical protein n=1 Tax=Bradyrhizobium tropiciagri TaxID=312253 RepID=UPI001BAC3EBF|nr:hypothetical protein [Bradyrhizobium tropiciagri]MBR0868912.1 hypothetical protein [Bradyrhizobium tropiciagri]